MTDSAHAALIDKGAAARKRLAGSEALANLDAAVERIRAVMPIAMEAHQSQDRLELGSALFQIAMDLAEVMGTFNGAMELMEELSK